MIKSLKETKQKRKILKGLLIAGASIVGTAAFVAGTYGIAYAIGSNLKQDKAPIEEPTIEPSEPTSIKIYDAIIDRNLYITRQWSEVLYIEDNVYLYHNVLQINRIYLVDGSSIDCFGYELIY